MSPLARGLRWIAASCALLVAGFAAVVAGLYLLGLATGSLDTGIQSRAAMLLYFRVVLVKGLLPQLVLALALWPLLGRVVPGVRGSRTRLAVGLAVAALLAYAVVAPLLLATALPGWPALQMRSPAQHVGTALLCLAAVVAAGLAGRRVAG